MSLRGAAVVEIGRNSRCTNMRQQTKKPNRTFARHYLRTATAPHWKLQPAKLRDAQDGVCEGVGCTRPQAVVGSEKRLTRCFLVFEVASEKHKKLANAQKKCFHFAQGSVAYNGYYTSPVNNSLKYYQVLVFRRMIHLFSTRSRRRRRRCCGRRNYVPVMGILWGTIVNRTKCC